MNTDIEDGFLKSQKLLKELSIQALPRQIEALLIKAHPPNSLCFVSLALPSGVFHTPLSVRECFNFPVWDDLDARLSSFSLHNLNIGYELQDGSIDIVSSRFDETSAGMAAVLPLQRCSHSLCTCRAGMALCDLYSGLRISSSSQYS